LGTDAVTVQKFDVFRKKRNVSDYEHADTISDAEADDMRRLAEKLRADLTAWIGKNHSPYKT